MSCCDTSTGFPNAGLAKEMARNHTVIWGEICAIQQAILKAISGCEWDDETGKCVHTGGSFCVIVGGDTPMTWWREPPADGEDPEVNPYPTDPYQYYLSLIGQLDDCGIKDQIEQVVAHFTNLGYTILPHVDPDTGETIMWEVCWC